MSSSASGRSLIHATWTILAGLLILLVFRYVGQAYLWEFQLDLGRITIPGPRYAYFVAVWFFFGVFSAGFLGVGLALVLGPRTGPERFVRGLGRIPDGVWVTVCALIAFLLPVMIRAWLLRDVPITDDEDPYRFMAEVLARGELWAPSPPIAEAFDRKFMINNGKFYSQYFLGWPALMVPGVWVGKPEYMNAVYAALTTFPVFFVVRRHCGSATAKAISALYIAAPMLMMGAATAMSHTSCLAALAYTHWMVLRATDDDAPWWSHAAVAVFFSLGFFIRPTPALGGGVPLLIYWFARNVRRRPGKVAIALVSLGIPAAACAGLFLGVNELQNEDPFKTAYATAIEYAHSVNFREWGGPQREGVDEFFRGLDNPVPLFATMATAVYRFNFALFGWPISYLFALAALGRKDARLSWAVFAGLFIIHSFVISVGVDTFGPVKYFEAGWPALVLTGMGLERSTRYLAQLRPPPGQRWALLRPEALPGAVLAALIVVSTVGYTRVRLAALETIGENINKPFDALRERGIHHAVVFAPRGFAPRKCTRRPTRHFQYQQPMNNPEMTDDIIWVNKRNRRINRKVLELFPNRRGYVMRWTKDCKLKFDPLYRPGERPKPNDRSRKPAKTGRKRPGKLGPVIKPAVRNGDKPDKRG